MPLASEENLKSRPYNITNEFRETFETFTNGVRWNLTQDANDIVQLDGNAVSASYIAISKDPLTVGGVTTLESVASYDIPVEIITGLSMSQRILGQELSMELVSTETPLTPVADLAIASITQSTTTLTVTTTTAHGFVAGKRIGIYGVTSDSRLNYPSLVIASIVSPTSFTCTAGPMGTISSVTVGPFTNQGYVYFRPALNYAQNGISEIFENTTTTNASLYVRAAAGDALPTGTAAGNHSLTVGSTGPTQSITASYTYAFLPTTEYRFIAQTERVQCIDGNVDSSAMPSARLVRTQVVPDSSKKYKLRFRVTNNKGLTVPTAKIVSAAKTGTTTATITTASAHGLTTGDYIVVYGIRDQTNFANATSQTVVSSVINSTQFTVVFGSAVTATSYGGMVARVQGSNIPGSFTTVVASTATVNSINELTIVSTGGTWSWSIGDYVNVYGLRDNTAGNDLGLDGAYKVVDVSTTTIKLIPINPATTLTPMATTNCGGTIIKRTDIRLSFVDILNYLRERIEVQATGTQSSSVPVVGTVSVNGGSNILPFNQNTYTIQTSTNLTSSATYTGSALNFAASTTSAVNYNAQLVVGVTHTAGLTPGQLYVDLGTEASSTAPTVWYTTLAVPIPSNANWQHFTLPLAARYYRLRFVNGATAQTNFRLTTNLTYNGGGLSNQYSLPQFLLYPLTTTALAGAATFTGVTMDFGDTMNIYKTFTAVAYSDQVSGTNGFQIQISRDGTNWRVAQQSTTVASTIATLSTPLIYRYARVVYTNGATLQGTFSLDVQASVT